MLQKNEYMELVYFKNNEVLERRIFSREGNFQSQVSAITQIAQKEIMNQTNCNADRANRFEVKHLVSKTCVSKDVCRTQKVSYVFR